MIVALCPLDNAFDTAADITAIELQLARAAAGGASLAVFPECGLTGFKARQDLSHAHIADALEQVRALASSVLGGSLAVAPDGTLLHPFEPHRREPILVRLPSR